VRRGLHADHDGRGLRYRGVATVAIVLGVAPLLFVQVIYDPFGYTSNVLSACRVIGFILILLVGYTLLYVFSWRNAELATAPKARSAWALAPLAGLLGFVGFAHWVRGPGRQSLGLHGAGGLPSPAAEPMPVLGRT
jgi:hypothetical protein